MKKHSSTTSKQTTALNHTLGQSRAYNYGLMHTHIILRERLELILSHHAPTLKIESAQSLQKPCNIFLQKQLLLVVNPSKSTFLQLFKINIFAALISY